MWKYQAQCWTELAQLLFLTFMPQLILSFFQFKKHPFLIFLLLLIICQAGCSMKVHRIVWDNNSANTDVCAALKTLLDIINTYFLVFSKSEVQSQSEQNPDLQVTHSSCCWITLTPVRAHLTLRNPHRSLLKHPELGCLAVALYLEPTLRSEMIPWVTLLTFFSPCAFHQAGRRSLLFSTSK